MNVATRLPRHSSNAFVSRFYKQSSVFLYEEYFMSIHNTRQDT